MPEIHDCPWCDEDIEINLGFAELGKEFPCPHCGKVIVVSGDYCGEDSWYFTLEKPLP